MPMTTAERQKKYREKLKLENPCKLEQLKIKNTERTRKNYKKIGDFSEADQKKMREKWRKEKQKTPNQVLDISDVDKTKYEKRKMRSALSTENIKLKSVIKEMSTKIKNLKKTKYRYKMKINKLINFIEKLQEKKTVEEINNKINKKTQEKQKAETPEKNNNPKDYTPLSKTQEFIEKNLPAIHSPEKRRVTKALFESNVLKESLSQEYKKAKSNSERDVLKKIVSNEVVTKYKLKTKFHKYLGLQGSLKKKWTYRGQKLRRSKEIRDFLVRDDNSRITAGKKEVRTMNKNKMQIRYLLDSMTNLHQKYKEEGGEASYVTFTRYRPFYVLDPRITDRNTCSCMKHANLKFMAQKLKHLEILKTEDLNILVSEVACDTSNINCMYGECSQCSKKNNDYNLEERDDNNVVTWNAWMKKKYEYTKTNKNKEKEVKVTKKTSKEVMTGTIATLINSFSQQMHKFKIHTFNISHQYKIYKNCKESLSDNDIMVHCDFSENYLCKMTEEVQATHFGASKQQITIHTGVIYFKKEDKVEKKSFCSISPINDHGPVAVWAHITPVLKFIKGNFPKVTTLHMFTDGPTTQYRNKTNFYLLSKKSKELGFEKCTWSFFEASHGKGPADGIGGAVKRSLDKKVTHGQDITSAKSAYDTIIKDTSKIDFYYISMEDIDNVQKDLDFTGLIPVPKTMTIHQVLSTNEANIIKFRKLSCFCNSNCTCFGLEEHDLKKKKVSKKGKKTKQPQRKKLRETSSSSEEEEINYMDTDDEVYNVDSDLSDSYNDTCCSLQQHDIKKKNVLQKGKKPVQSKRKKLQETSSSSEEDEIKHMETDHEVLESHKSMKGKSATIKGYTKKVKNDAHILKCVGCEEDLISEAEEDDEKNIGCDKCPRWFHMKCTTKKGMSYDAVASQDFICHVCYI